MTPDCSVQTLDRTYLPDAVLCSLAPWRLNDRLLMNLHSLRMLFCGYLAAASSCTSDREIDQPIHFSHRQHVEKKLGCTFCHAGAEKNSQATLPSVTLCMSCHSVVKAESPEVLKTKAYLDRKEEIPWRRIYASPKDALVFFNHRRHAAAGVKCDTCHGDVGARDVLSREVELTMGFCVKCHEKNEKSFHDSRLAADCATCHR